MTEYESQPSRRPSWHYILLWLIVLISLGINIFLVVTLINLQREAQESVAKMKTVAEIFADVDPVELQNFDIPVVIDETLPISLTVPFNDTFQVPIKTTVPISTSVTINENISVPINDVVSLNRNATIVISVLGQSIPVDIPIRADIPLNMQTNVPINMEVPIELEIPIDLMVEVPVNTEVPIDAEIPVQMQFPVSVSVDEMGISASLMQLQEALHRLGELLEEPAGG
jgi:hypothetical protein